jgi:hypothetical protein
VQSVVYTTTINGQMADYWLQRHFDSMFVLQEQAQAMETDWLVSGPSVDLGEIGTMAGMWFQR